MSYEIVKYASSGIYQGEQVAEFETLLEANEFLKNKASIWESKGNDYFADYELNSNELARLELTADSLADCLVYRVKPITKVNWNESEDEF